jgi:hypothetical protein
MVSKPGIYFYNGESYKELVEVTRVSDNQFKYWVIISGNENAKYYDPNSWELNDAYFTSTVGRYCVPAIKLKEKVFELIFGDIVMFNPRR